MGAEGLSVPKRGSNEGWHDRVLSWVPGTVKVDLNKLQVHPVPYYYRYNRGNDSPISEGVF